MRELRQPIDPFGEHRVEAVDEQEDLAASWRALRELSVQRLNERLVAIEISFVVDDVIDVGIARRRRRPFDLAHLVVRGDRNCKLGVARGGRPVAIEQCARPLVALARRCDKQGVVDGAGRTVGHGAEKAALRPRGAGDEREGEKHDRQNGKWPLQQARRPEGAAAAQLRDRPPLAPTTPAANFWRFRALPQRTLKGNAAARETENTALPRFPLSAGGGGRRWGPSRFRE